MSKEKLTKRERMIPQLAVRALQKAQDRAKQSGLPMVLVIGDGLYRIDPDGTKTLLKTLPPKVPVTSRTKVARST